MLDVSLACMYLNPLPGLGSFSLCGEGEGSFESSGSRAARRRRMELRRVRIDPAVKRRRMDINLSEENCGNERELDNRNPDPVICDSRSLPKFGIASVCGRRRDMEDAVAIHPSFCHVGPEGTIGFHFFGVYDGHGCSHVASRCKERLHEIVKEELLSEGETADITSNDWWKCVMERSFTRMDEEVVAWNNNGMGKENENTGKCRCELQAPECDAVGSTAVVAVVTQKKIVVANCGDSRAVLCRDGQVIPLSADHKPDRPDELSRIQAAGGRVIYWEGARVLGVLAMSRAIGDNYLKPYVSCLPEVTITERMEKDECLILASDGMWDVVANDTACGVAHMCLRGGVAVAPTPLPQQNECDIDDNADKACSDASVLLTKLALARNSADNVSVVVIDLRRGS